MRRLSKNTVKALITLLNVGEIRVREFPDKTLAERLVSSGCIKRERITKSSSRFVLISDRALRICCADYDERLKDVEGYYESLESGGSRMRPSEEIAKYGRDHLCKRNLWRGFFLKSNVLFNISYNGQPYTIGPDAPFLVEKIAVPHERRRTAESTRQKRGEITFFRRKQDGKRIQQIRRRSRCC